MRKFLSFIGKNTGRRCADEDIEIMREEVTGEWRRLHNEKLHDCTFKHVFRDPDGEDQMGGACGMNGGKKMSVQY